MGLPLWFANVFPVFAGSALPVRVMLCIAIMAPAGILMGFGFPTGMRLISLVDRKPTPWFWGVNGAAGVFASIVAVACSIAFGISVTLLAGGAFYLLLIPTTLGLLWPKELVPDPAGMLPEASAQGIKRAQGAYTAGAGPVARTGMPVVTTGAIIAVALLASGIFISAIRRPRARR